MTEDPPIHRFGEAVLPLPKLETVEETPDGRAHIVPARFMVCRDCWEIRLHSMWLNNGTLDPSQTNPEEEGIVHVKQRVLNPGNGYCQEQADRINAET